MIPSVLATQLQSTLLDYLQTTFNLSDQKLESRLFQFLQGPEGLLKGPFIDVRLPFRKAADEAIPLEIAPSFTPYTHQLVSFRRLTSAEGHTPQHTLVTTGTGSGKTECFLYPILDHCWRHRHQRGIKAILLYPMNALANDQARRLAQLLHTHPLLKGQVSAGLYIGGKGTHGATGPDHLIDDRKVLRTAPPDILLTNYRMLDFLLLRPEDQPLWSRNGPDTLRYLVLDELHTYDGAQGSDVACLIRRLKERLEVPSASQPAEGALAQPPERAPMAPSSLTFVGTSATIGARSDPESSLELVRFASQVFGEEFDAGSVVEEDRYAAHEVLGMDLEFDRVPRPEELAALDPDGYSDADAWLQAQKKLWLEDPGLDAVPAGERLARHSFLRSLLSALDGRLAGWQEVAAALKRLEPDFEALPAEAQWPVLSSFLGLVSWARRPAPTEQDPSRTEPFFTCQVQLWIREVRRLVARVGAQPDFGWHGEMAGEEGSHSLPLVYCRECGASGFGAVQREGEDRLRSVLEETNRAWLDRDRKARYVRLGVTLEGEFPSYLCPGCLRYSLDPRCPKCDVDGLVARVEANLSEASPPRFQPHCPDCGTEDSLGILGSRAASLLSVAISHVFLSPFNQDRKLLAFTDSVQDASHRAGYFAARTYRFNMRSALQAVVAEDGRVSLADFAERLLDVWEERMKDDLPRLIASLLPPDLNDLPEHQEFKARGGRGSNRRLMEILRKRLAWEATAEYGLRADIGRSLERSGSSICEPDQRALRTAAECLREDARERNLLARNDLPLEEVLHFLEGLLHRYQRRGGVYHPLLKTYIANGGSPYLLTKRKNPLMPFMGRGTKRPLFLVDSAAIGDLDTWISRGGKATWYRDWLARALGVDRADPGVNDFYAAAVQRLTLAGLLQSCECKKATAYALNPERMLVGLQVHHVRCRACGVRRQVSPQAASRWAGRPCLSFRCGGRYEDLGPVPESYYSRIYGSGEVRRVFAAEHTGLLERRDREELEHRFKTGEGPGAPNLLVCTPTLEMGVDVGDLSAALVCSVPPTTSNFLQRIGRAGRKTGNALCLTMANHEPHDLYFYASPHEMMSGQVLPPGCFLDAPEMLKRQLAAYAMDCWAKQEKELRSIPPFARLVLGAGQKKFPGRLLDFFRPRAAVLTDRFLTLFGHDLGPAHMEEIRAFGQGEAIPDLFLAAFEAIRREREELKKLRAHLSKRIDEIQADPDCVADPEAELQDLHRAVRVVERCRDQIGQKYPLNVLTDAGVLPNYAFPEPGVTLQALVADRQGKGEGKPRYAAHEYIRPASLALRELAPFNTFYAEGRKVQVSQIDVGSRARPLVEKWRLCPHCTHAQRANPDGEPPTLCPRCGMDGWGDSGQVRDLVKFQRALSFSDMLESRTVDDTDERDSEFYVTADLIDAGPQNSRGAWTIERLPFGIELHEHVTLRELNFGLQTGIGAKFNAGGRQYPETGFDVCLRCGYVRDPRERHGPEHAAWCAGRTSGKAERRAPLYLYREIVSDAVRILLPVLTEGVAPDRASFKAAFQLGLRRRFRGNPGHLAVKAHSEPVAGEATARREFLVLYDGVPGGTGYLGDLGRPEGFRGVLELALEAMRSCACRLDPSRDGCYRCVYAYQSQRELPDISRRRAVDLVGDILARWDELQQVTSLSDVTLAYRMESELETRFVRVLAECIRAGDGDTWTDTMHHGKHCWKLALKEGPVWLLEPQVDVGSAQGVDHASRPDFMLRPLAGAPMARPVAVFCDGLAYHVKPTEPFGGLADDLRKRKDLIATGKHAVWSVTWKDLDDFEATGPAKGRPTLFSAVSRQTLEKMAPGLGVTLPATAHELGSLGLLEIYLRRPEPLQWRLLAQATLLALLGKPFPEMPALLRLGDRLWEEPAAFAPGPIGLLDAPPAILGRVLDGRPWLLGVVRVPLSALQQRKSSEVRILLRLFDEAEGRRAPEFEEAWRTFLAGWNLLQFHEGTEVLSSEWLDSEGEFPVAEPLVAEPQPAAYASDALSELLDLADPAVHGLLRSVAEASLPLPEVGFEVSSAGRVVGELELAWPDRLVAVGAQEVPGWQVLPLSVTPDDLLLHLNPGGS